MTMVVTMWLNEVFSSGVRCVVCCLSYLGFIPLELNTLEFTQIK